jgi:crotonobetainyl-CoA:carnitine CoA-transferase CaiB-like acyl-CoA transferase
LKQQGNQIGAGTLLNGYRVLDLSQYIPGPFATRQLADMGAEVIKIEPPGGDPMRYFMGAGDNTAPSPLYRHLNRGKQVAMVDLKSATGKALLGDLLQQADVLLESFRPGTLQRLGFDRRQIRRINPKLVHCALSGFGQTGPYRQRAGHDLTYCAVSGALDSDRPGIPFTPLADHAGAMQATTAILAALLERGRSGRGHYLDIALNESILAWQYPGLIGGGASRGEASGLLLGGAACYNLYTTADRRWVALAALEQKFWRRFCNAVGRDDWIDRQCEPLPQSELIQSLQKLFASRSLNHWLERLSKVDCCFEAVLTGEEVAAHPQLRARGILTGMEPGCPVLLDDTPSVPGREPWLLGAEEIPRWQAGRNH